MLSVRFTAPEPGIKDGPDAEGYTAQRKKKKHCLYTHLFTIGHSCSISEGSEVSTEQRLHWFITG